MNRAVLKSSPVFLATFFADALESVKRKSCTKKIYRLKDVHFYKNFIQLKNKSRQYSTYRDY